VLVTANACGRIRGGSSLAQAVLPEPPGPLVHRGSAAHWNSRLFFLLLNRVRLRRTLSCALFVAASLTSRIAMVLASWHA
jgi:hypothetical protein